MVSKIAIAFAFKLMTIAFSSVDEKELNRSAKSTLGFGKPIESRPIFTEKLSPHFLEKGAPKPMETVLMPVPIITMETLQKQTQQNADVVQQIRNQVDRIRATLYSWTSPSLYTASNNRTHLIRSAKQTCVDFKGSLATPEDCVGDGILHNVVVYKKDTSQKTWKEAKEDCENEGGRLFDDLNAESDLLNEICEHSDFSTSNYRDFYTGIWAPVISKSGEQKETPQRKWMNGAGDEIQIDEKIFRNKGAVIDPITYGTTDPVTVDHNGYDLVAFVKCLKIDEIDGQYVLVANPSWWLNIVNKPEPGHSEPTRYHVCTFNN